MSMFENLELQDKSQVVIDALRENPRLASDIEIECHLVSLEQASGILGTLKRKGVTEKVAGMWRLTDAYQKHLNTPKPVVETKPSDLIRLNANVMEQLEEVKARLNPLPITKRHPLELQVALLHRLGEIMSGDIAEVLHGISEELESAA